MPDRAIFHRLTAAATAEAKVAIHKVPTNRRLVTTLVEIILLADAALDLSLSLWEGEDRRLPETGSYQGNNVKIVSTARKEWGPGSEITVRYKNTHASESRTALISISAEET